MAKVLFIIAGGVAAYKALETIRLLKTAGIDVTGVMTAGAQAFITPLSVTALTGNPTHTALFSMTDEAEMGHIALSRAADLVVAAPATANLLASMAHGLAHDLATTLLLATDKPVMVAPAMNVRMWEHPATQRNVRQLVDDGIRFVGPTEGSMACGETGMGRLVEPHDLVEAILGALAVRDLPLKGRHVLITAGPSVEALDPVRVLTNRSSGKQGYALAHAAQRLGARVTLVSGPVALASPPHVTRVQVESAAQMWAAVEAALPADIFIGAAAVADFQPEALPDKARKVSLVDDDGRLKLKLTPTPDVLASVSQHASRPSLVVGFAAETKDVVTSARHKLVQKKADIIVANDVSPSSGVMGGDHNSVHVVTAQGVENWPQLPKHEVALRLMQLLADRLVKTTL